MEKEKLIQSIIREKKHGVALAIRVKPGSKDPGIKGLDRWRRCIRLSVEARAEEGKANQEVLKRFQNLFGKGHPVEIISGNKRREKKIFVKGVSEKGAEKALSDFEIL